MKLGRDLSSVLAHQFGTLDRSSIIFDEGRGMVFRTWCDENDKQRRSDDRAAASKYPRFPSSGDVAIRLRGLVGGRSFGGEIVDAVFELLRDGRDGPAGERF